MFGWEGGLEGVYLSRFEIKVYGKFGSLKKGKIVRFERKIYRNLWVMWRV